MQLATLRGTTTTDPDVGLDAALTALSGRVRLHDSASSSPEEIITALWHQFMDPEGVDDDAAPSDGDTSPGKVQGRKAARTTTTRS